MIHDVTELEVYNRSMELLEQTYGFLRNIPRSEYDTIDQLKRAAKSIPANISEGFAKRTYPKEFKRFLQIAIGSSDECVTHLRTLYITVPKHRATTQILAEEYKILSKRTNKLRTSWIAD